MVLTTSRGVVVAPVSAAAPRPDIAPKSAYSVWQQPAGTGLDALGSWVFPGNDPAAASGQLTPTYFYGHYFGFTESPSALGVSGLVTHEGGKHALLSVVDAGGTAHSVGIRYDWVPSHAYYLFVAQLGPTSFAAWVYDHGAATWTPIGGVDLPGPLGKISPTTVATAFWFGPPGGACSEYPRADVYFHPPDGYVGTTATTATRTDSGPSADGECPAAASTELSPWVHLRLGADLE